MLNTLSLYTVAKCVESTEKHCAAIAGVIFEDQGERFIKLPVSDIRHTRTGVVVPKEEGFVLSFWTGQEGDLLWR